MNLHLTDLPKGKVPYEIFQQQFKELNDIKYEGWDHNYTEYSKSEIGVGGAAITENQTKSTILQKIGSIFSSETHAIHLAHNSAKNN